MRNKGFVAVTALTLYFGTYLALWRPGIDIMHVYTMDRGCIAKYREEPELRFSWIARGPLRAPVTAIYWPINTFLVPQSEWK